MKLYHGLREADITRRERTIISWLDPTELTPGKELAELFGEWIDGPYAHIVHMLTAHALERLVDNGVARRTEVRLSSGGLAFPHYALSRQSAVEVDPSAVELTPRESSLLYFIGTEPTTARTAQELNASFKWNKGPNPERTETCLNHLAKIGLLETVESPQNAYCYKLPPHAR